MSGDRSVWIGQALPTKLAAIAVAVVIGWGAAVSPTLCRAQTTVAGRTVESCKAELKDSNRVVRCAAARTLGAFGEAAGPALTEALTHDDPAVRYLAASHLGRIGGKPLDNAKKNLRKLFQDDSSAAVRLSAAYALCAAGDSDDPLRLLITRLESPERAMCCSAAEMLGQLGATAAPALSALEKARDENLPGGKGDYHLGGAATEAMRKIRAALAKS